MQLPAQWLLKVGRGVQLPSGYFKLEGECSCLVVN